MRGCRVSFIFQEEKHLLYKPILSQLSSISFLCFKYMGQTWPSNRPAGSGTVYVLVLQRKRDQCGVVVLLKAVLWCPALKGILVKSLQELVTFSSFCTPHKEWKCRNICHRHQ